MSDESYKDSDIFRYTKYQVWFCFICVTLITFFVFLPDLKNTLLEWDDTSYITYNENIRILSPQMVRWAVVEFYTNYWAPLTWISYSLDYALWGLNPVGYHLTNNVIHACNAGLFFLLSLQLLTLTGYGDYPERRDLRFFTLCTAVLAALLFSIHPLRVESVAWAAERKDVLSLFFGILAVVAYLKYTGANCLRISTVTGPQVGMKLGYLWVALSLYCCSLLSKSTLVTMPVLLLILDLFPLKRHFQYSIKRLIIEKIPFVLCALFATGYTLIAHKQYGSIMPLSDANIFSRILLALKGIGAYVWFTFWPLDISPFYVHPGNISFINFEYIAALLFFITASAFSIWQFKNKNRPIVLGVWLLYLVALLPLLGFVKGGNEGIAARFSYIPSLPLSLFIAMVVTHLISKQTGAVKVLSVLVVTVALILLGGVTIKHISFWQNDVTLWTRVIDLQPHATGRAYFQRANAYIRTGEFYKALADVNEALVIATQKQVKHLYPIYGTRAEILKNIGDDKGALANYGNAISSAIETASPALPQYYYLRGNQYQKMGDTNLADEDFKMSRMR